MAYEFDIFLSCAGEDLAIARELSALMTQVGLRVWLYEEQIPAGADVQPGILQGIDAAMHAVLLVTLSWLKKEYTHWEARVLGGIHDPARRVIPLLPRPISDRDFPAELSFKDAVVCDWSRDGAFPLLWLVLHASARVPELGPKLAWATRGRDYVVELGRKGPAAAGAPPAVPVAGVSTAANPVLKLGRKAQWERVRAEVASTVSQLWLVWGDHRQAQLMFLRRIKLMLPKATRQSIVTVRWDTRLPASRPEFERALAGALRIPEAELVNGLKMRVADSDLILVHEPLFEPVVPTEALLAYYTEWIPNLLDEIDPNPVPTDRIGRICFVQSLGWARPRGLTPVAGAMRWLGVANRWVTQETEVAAARAFVTTLRRKASNRLQLVLMDELRDLAETEIRTWTLDLPDTTDREALYRSLRQKPLDTEAVFERAAKSLAGMGRIDDD